MKTILQKYLAIFDSIIIFRHVNPDGDALGSQSGFTQWLKDNYPEKKVYVAGFDLPDKDLYFYPDTISDEIFNNSLAIALDCGNLERIDDQRIKLCSKILKIDHHLNVDQYGDDEIVDTKSAATCQLLCELFREFDDNVISKACATFLYRGILTDSQGYKTLSTSVKTLETGAYLASKGLDLALINRELQSESLNNFKIRTIVRSKLEIIEKFGYCLFTLEELEKYQLSPSQCRNYVSEFMNIEEITIWAIFNERLDNNNNLVYDGSLRSKTISINDIANKYHGGGHNVACGVKNMTSNEYQEIMDELINKSIM